MLYDKDLLAQLEQLLYFKKSRKFYAQRLGITEEDVNELMKEFRTKKTYEKLTDKTPFEETVRFEENIEKGTGQIFFNSDVEIKTLDELIEKCKIDTKTWEVVRYVQNYWGNPNAPHWQVKAWLSKIQKEKSFQTTFIEFLDGYEPSCENIEYLDEGEATGGGCLIINKQDAHLNKYDINGDNYIFTRFSNILNKTVTILNQATLSNSLDSIIYILGSDEFNSEFTSATTKGTPQENILPYYESFEHICNHEVEIIKIFLQKAKSVQVLFIPGNHDEYVGWHMVNWLKTYFRNIERISFDTAPNYRKYISFGNSAIMFNHGYDIKPQKLAGIFPIEFKEYWSKHNNFYIFTGDKHVDMSQDINGIQFYQLPAFSTTTSKWEDRKGYVATRAEATGFLIDENYGITNIFKQYL